MIKKLFIIINILIIAMFLTPSLGAAKSNDLTLKTFYKPWVRSPGSKAVIPVVAANNDRDNVSLKLKTVSVFYKDKLLATTSPNESLLPISEKGVTEKEFNQMLNFKKASKKQKEHLMVEAEKIDQDIEIIPLTVDLKRVDSSLSVGQKIDLTIEANYIQEGVTQTTTTQTQAMVAAMLPVIDGWRPGDAHLHSYFSSDNEWEDYSIDYISSMGKNRGLKWLIFTDHAQQMDFSKWADTRATNSTNRNGYFDGNIDIEWQTYSSRINATASKYKLPIGKGLEMSTIDPNSHPFWDTGLLDPPYDSHYLAYGISKPVINYPTDDLVENADDSYTDSTVPWGGKRENRNGQQIINAVNSSGGFGMLSHPFSTYYPWFNNFPYTSGFRGMELSSGYEYIPYPGPLSGELKESGQLLKWDELLWNGLNNTINPKKNRDMLGNFVVGTMNSDGSGIDGPIPDYEMYGEKFTYLYNSPSKPVTPKKNESALKNGRVVASTGPLVTFTINGQGIGKTVSITKGKAVNLKIKWKRSSTYEGKTRIWVIRNAGYGPTYYEVDLSDPYATSGEATFRYPTSGGVTKNGYFRVSMHSLSDDRVAFANPIFTKVTKPSPKTKVAVKVRNFITKSAIAGAAFGTDDRRYITTTNNAGEGNLDIPLAVYNQIVEDVEGQEGGSFASAQDDTGGNTQSVIGGSQATSPEAKQLFNFLAEANRYSSKVIKDIELTGGQTQTLEVELDPFAITNDRPDDNNFQSTFNPSDYNGGQFDYDHLRLAIKKGKLGVLLLKDLFEANEAYKNLPPDVTEEEKEAKETDITTAFDIYASNRDQADSDYKTSPDVALLEGGSSREFTRILKEFKEPVASVNSQFTPSELANYPVLIIPTGALTGLETSPIFKASLEEYVNNGGTIITLAQQRGEHYRVLPGGELFGKGWQEAISCRFGDAEIDNYHPILASLRQISDINQDGYFTQYPENAKILIRGTTNAGGYPVLLTYPFGKGKVVAASIYPDWSYGLKQETPDDKTLIRDMISWAKDVSTSVPEFRPNSAVEVTQKVTNFTSEEEGEVANAVEFTLMSPGRKPLETKTVDLEEELAPGQSTDVKFITQNLTQKGIYFVDYRLLLKDEGFDENENPVTDTEEIQPQAEGARFTVTDYKEIPGGYANQGTDISYGITIPEERLATGSDAVFNVWVQNDGQTEQEITARYGNNEETKLLLQTGESKNFTYTLSNVQSSGTFRVSFFNSAGELIGQASKGYWVFAPDVDLAVDLDKLSYQPGDIVSLSVEATNKKPVDFTATLKATVFDQSGLMVSGAQEEISLTSNQASIQKLDLALPNEPLIGLHIYQVEALYMGGKIGLFTGLLDLQKASLSITPQLPIIEDKLSFKIKNFGSLNATATLNANISEGGLSKPWQDAKTIEISSNSEIITDFPFAFANLPLAQYQLNYSLNYDNKSLEGHRNLGLPEVLFIADKASYRIRDNMTGNLVIKNASQLSLNSLKLEVASGEFLYSSSVDLPDLASGTQATIPVSIPIPETALAGTHGFNVSLSKADRTIIKLFSFTISQSKLALTLDKLNYTAGDIINVLVENNGGVDTTFDYSARLADSRAKGIISNSDQGIPVKAGEQASIDFSITSEAKTDDYNLDIEATDLTRQVTINLAKTLKVAGIQADLRARTNKDTYFVDEQVTGLVDVTNGPLQLVNGLLNMQVYREEKIGSEIRVNSNAPKLAEQYSVAISGNRIVWGDARNGDYDIYMYDQTTNIERRITTNSSDQFSPAISGDKIVWVDYRNGNPDIYLYDLVTETEKRITTDLSSQDYPAISGDKIVWEDYNYYTGDNNIYLYDISTGIEKRITNDPARQSFPAISGDKIVWEDYRSGWNNRDIYLYDLATETEQRITTALSDQVFPAIFGNQVVWEDWRNGDADIYLYDLAAKTERRITTDPRSQLSPDLTEGKISWIDWGRGTDSYIYVYDISADTQKQVIKIYDPDFYNRPRISGDAIVWQDNRRGNWDIYSFDLNENSLNQVNSDESLLSSTQGAVSISNSKVVWQDDRNGNWDIYLFDLATQEERRITTNSFNQYAPVISGNKVIWLDERNGDRYAKDIYLYDLTTDTERRITPGISYITSASFSGDKIVWDDYYRNFNWEIYLYDLATSTEKRITTHWATQWRPAVSGNKIVWEDIRNGNWDIYQYDLETNTEKRITANNLSQTSPAIWGDKIVWQDNRNGDLDIYIYDPTTQVEKRITANTFDQYSPDIFGNNVVWIDIRNKYPNYEIYLYDLLNETEKRITTVPHDKQRPKIYEDKIVWEDYRNGAPDIYLVTLDQPRQSLWQNQLSVNLASNETINIAEQIGQLNTTGKLYFQGTLKSSLGQTLAQSTYPFYISPSKTSLTMSSDKKIYKPNENVTVSGTITNGADILLENKTLTVYKNDAAVYTENIILLAPGESKSYSFTTTAVANFNLKATFDDVVVEDSVKVVEPKAELTLDGPPIAGREPFNLNANLKNTGEIAISGKLTFSDDSGVLKEENISLESGEQKTVIQPVSISKNTNFKVDFVGDLNLSQTKTVIFGEKATMNINPEPAYLGGNVSVPYQIINTGQLDTSFQAQFNLEIANSSPSPQPSPAEGEGVLLQVRKDIFLAAGGSLIDNLYFENLLPGDYTLSYSTPFSQGQRTLKVVKQDALEATANLSLENPTPPVSDYGKVKVDVQTENVGLNDFSGTVKVESAFDKQEQELVITKGNTANPILYLNTKAALPGFNTVKVVLINSAGETVLELVKEINIPPADFQLTEINPSQSFSVGSNAGFSFEVKNTGFLEGQTTVSLDLHDIGRQEKTLWLKPQESQIVNFDFLVPLDIPEGSYKGVYQVSGQETQETTFNIQGLNLDVSVSLDKETYTLGQSAVLTLNISNLSQLQSIDMLARAQLGGAEDVQSFTLNQDQSVSLTVPVQNITNDRIFYGLYLNGGRSVYLNSIYVRINKDNLALVPDKQVYNAGDTVTMTVDTTETGILHVEALDLGYTNDIALTPPTTTFSFALPQVLSSGTYVLNYQLGEKSGSVKLDVAGYKITVNDTKLNKNEYSIGDDLRAVVEYTNEKEFNGRFIAWLERPDGRTDTLVDENRFFNQETSALEINGSIIGNSSGSYRLVYAFMIGDTILATAKQTLDVSGPSIVNIKTSKPSYRAGESASLQLETFNSKNSDAILKLQLNGELFKEETINIPAGYSSQKIDIGKQPLGVHTLKAILSNGNTNSAKETAFEVRDEQGPETTITIDGNLGNNEWYTSNVQVELNSKDDELGSGLDLIRYNLNQSGWQIYSTPMEISTEGTTDFYYYAQDLAGNFELPKIGIVKIDKTLPTEPTLDALAEFSPKDNPINLTWTPSIDQEGLSGISHYLLEVKEGESGNWQAIEEILSGNDYQYGGTIAGQTYYFRIRAVDNAGNISGYSNEVFTIVGKPEIAFNPLLDYLKGEVSLSVQPSNYNPTNFAFFLDDSAVPLGSTNPFILDTKVISDGEHIITATASDDLGNSASASIAIKIDNSLPITAAYKVKYRMGEVIKLKWLVEDPFTGGKAFVKIVIKRHKKEVATLDLGLHEIGAVQETVYEGSLKQGRYKYYIYATDQAGNEQANIAKGKLVIKGAKHKEEDTEEEYPEQDLEEEDD